MGEREAKSAEGRRKPDVTGKSRRAVPVKQKGPVSHAEVSTGGAGRRGGRADRNSNTKMNPKCGEIKRQLIELREKKIEETPNRT